MSSGNGDNVPGPKPSILARILGGGKTADEQQSSFWRTHGARERSRQARVKAQRDRKAKGGKGK